jgi:hypothetical protein
MARHSQLHLPSPLQRNLHHSSLPHPPWMQRLPRLRQHNPLHH